MKNYLTLTNGETGEKINLDITGVDFLDLAEQLDKLPKDENNRAKVGNIVIHQWGGGAIK